MDPTVIIRNFYKPHTVTYDILMQHGNAVAQKAILAAESYQKKRNFRLDLNFIYEASMLHDIGVGFTYAPAIGCMGEKPYIAHGYIGRNLLEKLELFEHAKVCERHTGTGIEKKEIRDRNLPLPHHDMVPITLEEKIICYADKFFSKSSKKARQEKKLAEIVIHLKSFSLEKANRFIEWHKEFS